MPNRPLSTFVVSITPFTAAGALDEPGLRAHLHRMRDAGVGVYLGGSGSGEGYTLSEAEAARVLELGVEELAGRVPVRSMGVEPRTAEQMIHGVHQAELVGVDAAQVYSLDQGHGNQPTQRELERYLRAVLDATTAPLVLSTHQSVGYLLPVDLVAALVRDTHRIVGVNCSTGDVPYLQRLIDAVDGRADVHVGGPMHALTCLAGGGQGFLSSDANLAPRLCASVIEHAARGDLGALHDAFRTLLRLFTATRALGGVAATKAALELLGLPGGPPRLPRVPLDESLRVAVEREMIDAVDLRALEGLT
jgi:4-hydroxy-tetrahydrodipicolinate synthase